MISIYITNLGKYNEGELVGKWLELPYLDEELDNILTSIGINAQYEEYLITDIECQITTISKVIGEYSNIHNINELAKKVLKLDEYEIRKFSAIAENEDYNIEELINIIYNLDCWDLYPELKNYKDVGEYFFYELQAINIPDNIIGYFDFEAFGRDIHLDNCSGYFSSYGYVIQVDTITKEL
jgi:antirestriction protein